MPPNTYIRLNSVNKIERISPYLHLNLIFKNRLKYQRCPSIFSGWLMFWSHVFWLHQYSLISPWRCNEICLYILEHQCKNSYLGQLFERNQPHVYTCDILLWPLVVWQVHGPDACITARVDIELFEVTGLPHLHHTVITTCDQVVAITAQDNGLKVERRRTEHIK